MGIPYRTLTGRVKYFLKNFLNLVLAAVDLCCVWAFSSYGKWGLLSSRRARASHCSGFSCLQVTGSRVAGLQ